VMGAAGLGAGVAYAVVAGEAGQVATMLAAALVTVPAVLVLAAVAVALFGWAPGAVQAAWAVLGVVAALDVLGDLLRLPGWAQGLSPLSHVPAVPAEDLAAAPLVALVVVAVGLAAAGLWGFRVRDLRSG
jgi:ABC-2 type transport system permease protein